MPVWQDKVRVLTLTILQALGKTRVFQRIEKKSDGMNKINSTYVLFFQGVLHPGYNHDKNEYWIKMKLLFKND